MLYFYAAEGRGGVGSEGKGWANSQKMCSKLASVEEGKDHLQQNKSRKSLR